MTRGVTRPVLAVIPTFLRKPEDLDLVAKCLVTLRETAPDAHVLVVDDGSPEPQLVAAVEAACESLGVWFDHRPTNEGFSRTVNVGLRIARENGCDAVLVNADIEFMDAGWLDAHAGPHRHGGPPRRRRRRPPAVPERPAPARRRLGLPARPRLLPPLPARPVRPARGARPLPLPRHRRAAADPPRDARARRLLRRGLPPLLRGRRLLPARVRGGPGVHLRALRAAPGTTSPSSARATPSPQIERWTEESTRGSGAPGARRPLPLRPGGPVMPVPRTLFVGHGKSAVVWYRCALPAMVLGQTGSASRGEPARAALRDRRDRQRRAGAAISTATTCSSSSRRAARPG